MSTDWAWHLICHGATLLSYIVLGCFAILCVCSAFAGSDDVPWWMQVIGWGIVGLFCLFMLGMAYESIG